MPAVSGKRNPGIMTRNRGSADWPPKIGARSTVFDHAVEDAFAVGDGVGEDAGGGGTVDP